MPAPGREGCGRRVRGFPGSGGRAAAGILGPLLILAIGLVLTFSRLPGMAGQQEMPDDLVIDTSGYQPDRKGAVGFSHLAHNEDYDVACSDCHHDYQDGKNVWQDEDAVRKCIECHSPLKDQGRARKLSVAYHKNCKNCHHNLAREGISEDAPYRSCYHCHERAS